MKFKLSKATWEKMNRINEKYHISCTEVDSNEDLEQFFYIFEDIGADPKDILYVNYIFDLYNLCSQGCDSTEEFLLKKKELKREYFNKLEKLMSLIGDC